MLTHAHLRALRDSPSAAVRADIAAAVAADLAAAALSAKETQIAEQILESLAHDAERRVRQALAEHLKECPFLPRQIAVILARDLEDEVALPIIEHSPLLNDDDLISYVRTGAAERQLAVARRKIVAAAVADALVATENPRVVGAVLANSEADVTERSLLRIAARFHGDETIETLLVDRPALPLAVCEVLIANVAANLRARLIEKHQIPEFLAEELTLHGREKALSGLLPSDSAEAGERLASHLHERRRLTPTLVLRALCLGDLCFFDGAMARLAGIPVANARMLLYDRGVGGFQAIYEKAALPPELFRAFRAAVGAVLAGDLKRGTAAFKRQIVDQLVRLYDDLSPASLDQVLAQLARRVMPREAANEPRGVRH
jgi:uncharacterized protein (DUF2336 family)